MDMPELRKDIQGKTTELKSVLAQYKKDLGALEKKLLRVIDAHREALREEKMKIIKRALI